MQTSKYLYCSLKIIDLKDINTGQVTAPKDKKELYRVEQVGSEPQKVT